MKKQITQIFLILTIGLVGLVSKAQTITIDRIKYELNAEAGTAKVIGYDYGITNANIKSSVNDNGKDYTVTEIGERAFHSCFDLASVTIPNSVTSIGDYAFSYCSGLTSITIPNSVTSIGDYAFSSCNGLTSVTIPNSVTSIGEFAFANCHGLTSVTIPSSVTTISNGTFLNCRGLISVTIPESITEIGRLAFSYCSGLTSVTIPNSVTEIGAYAFYECPALTEVYYAAEEPIEYQPDGMGMGIFSQEIYGSATLYVQEKAIEKCKEIDPWKNFEKVEAYVFSGIDEVSAGVNVPYEVFTIRGVKIGNSLDGLPKGVYIMRQGSKTTKIVI